MKDKHKNGCNSPIMTIANLEKLCRLSKNNNDNFPSPPLPPAKLKVFLHRKRHLTTAVIFSINFPLYFAPPSPPPPHHHISFLMVLP